MNQTLQWIVIGCLLFVLVLFFHKAFIKILKLCVRGAVGGVGFLAVNALLGALGLQLAVGINVVTFAVAALLGVPGFILLYAVQLVLR